jgi:hypothetical protein
MNITAAWTFRAPKLEYVNEVSAEQSDHTAIIRVEKEVAYRLLSGPELKRPIVLLAFMTARYMNVRIASSSGTSLSIPL